MYTHTRTRYLQTCQSCATTACAFQEASRQLQPGAASCKMLFPQHKAAGAKAEPSSLVYSANGWPGGSAAVHSVRAVWIRKARQVGSRKKRRFSVSGVLDLPGVSVRVSFCLHSTPQAQFSKSKGVNPSFSSLPFSFPPS